MAKSMTFLLNGTIPIEDVVYLPVGCYIDASAPAGKIDFLGYHGADAARKQIEYMLNFPGSEQQKPVPGAVVSYTATREEFARMFGALVGPITAACYDLAERSAQNKVPDPDHPEAQVSYFEGAEDVDVTPTAPSHTQTEDSDEGRKTAAGGARTPRSGAKRKR